ncbi:MAG: O-antigen ligase family protein [Solirubrobacteraceae bacterium]
MDHLYALIPGLLVVVLSFRAGGYFPGSTALAVIAIAVVLAARVALSRRPFAGLSAPYVVGACLLGLFALWTLISSAWSHAPARAIVEYDRALLYALAFVLLGSWGRTPGRLRWMVRGIAAGAFAVCACALITRLLPDVWQIAPELADDRLSYPLTYWNSLGLLAALAFVVSFALASDDREQPLGRVLAAAALPVLATTVLMTFSRGAIAAAAVGLVALIAIGRPRALPSALLVATPTVGWAVLSAYRAELLASETPTSAAATAQGHDVALVLVICTVLATVGRGAALRLDPWWSANVMPAALRVTRVTWALGLAAVAAVAIVAGAPAALSEQYERFTGAQREDLLREDNRERLATPRDNGRFLYWRVAVQDFSRQPLHGHGAGTFPLQWARLGRSAQSEDGHSLYVEVLGELGLVGLLLVVGAVLLVLGGFLARARGPDRVVGAALFAAGLAWALHAAVDWDWEMPAVTLWFFAAGGLALAAPASRSGAGQSPARGAKPIVRLGVALGCLMLVLVPARVRLSDGALRESGRALIRSDCATATDRATYSRAALEVRPEPHIILGYCDVRLGQRRRAVGAMQQAVRRDPENWEAYYALSLARASAGLDPRPAARFAGRLKPWHPLPTEALRLFDTEDPRKWIIRAPAARLPTD